MWAYRVFPRVVGLAGLALLILGGAALETPAAPLGEACSRRPSVQVTTVAAPGGFQVTVAATGANNALQALRFDDPRPSQNAIIDIGGQTGRQGAFVMTPPVGTISLSFTAHPVTPGQPTTVYLTVVDNCGSWPTFVGGGANALPNPSATPTVGAAPTSTVTRTPTPTSSPTATAIPTLTTQAIPLLSRPFSGDSVPGNLVDHDRPIWPNDTNGYFVTWWGERITGMVDGHHGLDFPMPEGTAVLAAADGHVVSAGSSTVTCPDGVKIGINATVRHQVGTELFETTYVHLSRVDVQQGQTLQRGQQVGLSGSTGCASGPHLHFSVYRFVPSRNAFAVIDPFGWTGLGTDPWAIDPLGAPSLYLWQPGQAPSFYWEASYALNPTAATTAPIGITKVRWMGVDDAHNPDNEYVDVTIDPRYVPSGTFSLTGWTLRNNVGATYSFPAGFTLTSSSPTVRVFTGIGQNTATQLYWGRTSGIWDNNGDCAHLENLSINYRYVAGFNNGNGCP